VVLLVGSGTGKAAASLAVDAVWVATAEIGDPACGAVGSGHVRLNFATPRPILTEIVRRMAEAVDRG